MVLSKNKILIITGVSLLTLAAGYFGIRWYLLQKAYNTVLDIDNAQKLSDQVTSDVSIDDDIIPDDVTTSDPDAPKGTVQQDINDNN